MRVGRYERARYESIRGGEFVGANVADEDQLCTETCPGFNTAVEISEDRLSLAPIRCPNCPDVFVASNLNHTVLSIFGTCPKK